MIVDALKVIGVFSLVAVIMLCILALREAVDLLRFSNRICDADNRYMIRRAKEKENEAKWRVTGHQKEKVK